MREHPVPDQAVPPKQARHEAAQRQSAPPALEAEEATREPSMDDALRSVVARHLDLGEADLTVDTSIEELHLDEELSALLLGAVGDEFEMRFPDDFLDGLYTYGQLHSAVRLAVGV